MAISGQKQRISGSDKPVQDRLLDAAEQLFAENGFDGTSVRDIASAAGCNIAAVNYYFGSKDKLYTEVWRRQLVQMRDARLQAIELVLSESKSKPLLEDLLRSFANAFIGRQEALSASESSIHPNLDMLSAKLCSSRLWLAL